MSGAVFNGAPAELAGFVADAAARGPFRRVLMADPAHFQVEYEINPHMKGNAGAVDVAAARVQWAGLRSAYESLGIEVLVCPGVPGLPDLVFAANQTLPFRRGDEPAVLLSNMARAERRAEPRRIGEFLAARGFARVPVDAVPLEGTGDALWHPGKNLIWGGHGFRTALPAWTEVAAKTGARVVPVHLVDERCYHLDVCLMPIDETRAFACRAAFDDDSWARLRAGFPGLIEADERETFAGFALNGHCPDGKTLLLPAGNPQTRAVAEGAGLRVIELQAGEFHKSGGSLFCLKNMLP